MKVADLHASFPIFRVESQVTYQTPRHATAIERYILRLCTELGDHPEFGNQPLIRLFVDWLCVPDAEVLVIPCFDDLRVLGVLSIATDADPASVLLRDLTITERGRELLRLGMIPGLPQHAKVPHLYDPISGIAWAEGRRSRLSQVPHAARTEDLPFREVDPSGAIRKLLPSEKHAWWSSTVQIDGVESRFEDAPLWSERTFEIDADEQTGVLRISVPNDKTVEAWLHRLDGGAVWEQFLSHAFVSQSGSGRGVPSTPTLQLSGARAAVTDAALQDALRDGEQAALLFERGPATMGDDAILQRTVRVRIEPGIPPAIAWNPTQDGAMIRMPDFQGLDGLVALWRDAPGKQPVAWCRGRVSLEWAGSRHLVVMGVRCSDATATAHERVLISRVLDVIAGSSDPMAIALRALVEPVDRVIDAAVRALSGTLFERANRMKAIRTRIEALLGSKIAPTVWEAPIRRMLDAEIRSLSARLSTAELIDAATAVQAFRLTEPQSIEGMLLERTTTPSDAAELRKICRSVGPKVSVPTRFFSPSVIRSLVEDAFGPNPDDGGWSEVEIAARAARAALDKVVEFLADDPESLVDEEACHSALPQIHRPGMEAITSWKAAAAQLRAKAGDDSTLNDTRFARIAAGVERLMRYLARLADFDPSMEHPVVLDTSALIDHPDILARLRKDETPVLPKRVLEELDRKKRDPAVGERVQEAIRAINRAGDRIRYEEGDMELLPRDFRESGDNLILSVAVRLRLLDPLLVTADRNLQNKARAQKLRFENPTAFLQRRTQQEAQKQAPSATQPKGNRPPPPTRRENGRS